MTLALRTFAADGPFTTAEQADKNWTDLQKEVNGLYLTGATGSLAVGVPSHTAVGDMIRVKAHSSAAHAYSCKWRCTSITASLPSGATAGDVTGNALGCLYVLKAGSQYYKFEIEGDAHVWAFGALGNDGDDTLALKAALATGKDVCIPDTGQYYDITAELAHSADWQRIYGGGAIRQTSFLLNVISTVSRTGVTVEGMYLYAGGGKSGSTTGNGVLMQVCTLSKVIGCTIENHRGAGVQLRNCNDCAVTENWFFNSPVADYDNVANTNADISIVYSSSRNSISGNYCLSGQASGIVVQSIVSGNSCNDNVITGNVVKGAKAYGIIAYRNQDAYPATEEVRRTVISGNAISDISGTILNDAAPGYCFGCGIYVQGAESSSVTGNTISNTHSGGVAFEEALAPGAIGVTNLSRCTITGNTIDQEGMYGIYIADPQSFGEPAGSAVISGNVISNTVRGGVIVRNRGRVTIANNTVDTAGDSGIEVHNTVTVRTGIAILGNTVRNVTSTRSGIEIKFGDALVSGNTIDTAGFGITAFDSSNIRVLGNAIKSHAVRGIVIDSTVVGATVLNNSVVGTGSSSEGIRLLAKTSIDKSNSVSGCTTPWFGDFTVLRGTQSASNISTAGAGEDNLHTYTLPAGAMSTSNDTLTISGWGLTANNANTKTLKLYFGSTLMLTTSLTVNQGSVWSVDATIIRTGAATQRCFAKLIQGGTVTVADVEYAAGTETLSSAVLVRFTGEATNDSDIQQFGMIAQFIPA